MSLYKNSLWSLINIIGVQIIAQIANIILARLLYPEIFGVLGLATLFTGLAIAVQDAGFNAYLVHKKQLNQKIIATILWANVTLSILITIILLALSNPISNFFSEDKLNDVFLYLSIGILLGSVGITGRAYMVRKGQFKGLTIIDVSAEIISSIFAVMFAIKGFEIAAVTSKLFIRPTIQTVLLLSINWKILIGLPSLIEFKSMLKYSLHTLSSQLFIYFNNNLDYFLIGKYVGSRALGIYSLAFQWSVLPRYYIAGAISKAAFSKIAQNQHDHLQVSNIFKSVVKKTCLLTFPLCILLALVSPEFIDFVYGDQWLETIPILQLLLMSSMITAIVNIGGPLYNGIGKPQIEMKINISYFIFLFIALIVGIKYGLTGAAIAILVSAILFGLIRIFILCKTLNIKLNDFFQSIKGPIMSSILLTLVVSIIDLLLDDVSSFIKLIILSLIGTCTYTFGLYLFDRNELKWLMSKLKIKKSMEINNENNVS